MSLAVSKLGGKGHASKPLAKPRVAAFRGDSSSDDDAGKQAPKKKTSMLDEIMSKGRASAPEPVDVKLENWLHVGIIVKCVNKKVAAGAYYKKKGKVTRLVEDFVAVVEMTDSGDELQLDQDDLETVIPNVGKRVTVLNGKYRASTATLLKIDVDDFSVDVEVDAGPHRGQIRKGVDYEDVSRTA